MSAIIYYFSATGNSLAVAKKLHQQLPDCRLMPIAALLDQDAIKPASETVGLVFPLYYLGMPVIIENFIDKLQLPDDSYLFAVVTRGSLLAGGALSQLKQALKAKNTNLNAGFYLTMPDNYTPFFNPHGPAVQKKQFLQCDRKITQIIQAVSSKHSKIEGAVFNCLRPLTHPKWVKRVKSGDREFTITADCNQCKLCAQICPVNNIRFESNHHQWQHHCEECLACLHACPQKAIRRGGSAKRPQYRHPEITVAEIIQQKVKI